MRTLPLELLIPILARWIFSCTNQCQLQTIELKMVEIKEYRNKELGWAKFELLIDQSIRMSKHCLKKQVSNTRKKQHTDVWIAQLTVDFIQELRLRKAKNITHFETFSNNLKSINYAR